MLEIHCNDLPALIEVHFACAGMKEAVVRSCSVINGVAIAAIPDRCLEQTTPIIAWVYEVDGTAGVTTVKINLIIEPRTRPCPNKEEIPEDVSDKYTEAITAMNAVLKSAEEGNLTVARAIADANGNNIPNTYVTQEKVNGETLNTDILAKVEELTSARQIGIHQFRLGGASYEKDEDGNAVNLPHNNYTYCFATVYVWLDLARVFLFGGTSQCLPVCHNTYHEKSDTWSGWVEMIESKKIGEQTVKHAETAGRADVATYIENDGTKFGRVQIWRASAFDGGLAGNGVYPLKSRISSVLFDTEAKELSLSGLTDVKQKTFVIKIYKLHHNSADDRYEPQFEFSTHPFRDIPSTSRWIAEWGIIQHIDGVDFQFKFTESMLTFAASVADKYCLSAIYEELT